MTELTSLKKLMLIKLVNQKSAILVVFLDTELKFQPDVCSTCHDLLMMSRNLSDTAVLNIKGAGYYCIISRISINDAVNLLQKADLKEKSGAL